MRRVEKKARAMAFEKTRRFFKKVKENLFPDGPFIGPQAEVAGMPGLTLPVPRSEKKPKTHMEFNTGGAPENGTPSRDIMEWNWVDIATPSEGPAGYRISYEQAQKGVSELLKSKNSSHQYLVYEAAKLCSNYPEAVKYTLHMIVGAVGEDYVFSPGETLDDAYAEPPKRRFRNRREFSDALGGTRDIPSLLSGLFRGVAKVLKRVAKTPDEDSVNRPYCAHFYDPTRGEGDKGLNVLNGDLKFKSALDRMKLYWRLASLSYGRNQKPYAFYSLGHLLHLVADIHVPAHTHNDIHGPTVFLGKLDSLEQWCGRADYPHLQRPEDKPNIRIWDSGPLAPPPPDQSWNKDNIEEKLTEFANSVVANTQRFRSVDAKGTDQDQRKTGKLSDDECFHQGSTLIPRAISSTAQMIANFLDYQRRHGR